MRSAALAFKDDYEDASVSSQEALERDAGAIRADLNELKADFRAAVKRLDERIDAAVTKLESEIRAMAAKAAKAARSLQQFATRIEAQLAELRAENKSLRDKVHKSHDLTTAHIMALDKSVHSLSTRVSLLIWFVGLLGAIILGVVSVGKALNWFCTSIHSCRRITRVQRDGIQQRRAHVACTFCVVSCA
jgi:hypothetical protein